MNAEILWQDWLNIERSLNAGQDVPAPKEQVLEVGGSVRSLTFRLYYLQRLNADLVLEAAPELGGPWTELHRAATAGMSVVTVTMDGGGGGQQLQRYVRWLIKAPNSSPSTSTFKIGVILPDGCTCGQAKPGEPYVKTVAPGSPPGWIGLYLGATVNEVVQSSAFWRTTAGLSRVLLQVSTACIDNGTIDIEGALAPEGPWTSVLASPISTIGITTSLLTLDAGSTTFLYPYLRWKVTRTSDTCDATFLVRMEGRK